MPKQLSTRFSIVKRSAGQSAVEKASYISREEIGSEYDGNIYRPKYKEDLVHSEISLPENAPKEYADRARLWNAVELSEKGKNAQLARMLKASLPNEWSYETAEEIVRKYVQDNFISKGMCADWAIHDSVNEQGQRNLHFHCLLTLRPIEQDGTWGAKSRKVYILDEAGNKIRNRNGKGYKCTTEQTTDWNNSGKAKEWRRNLADLINASNAELGINEKWEHRSFKEQGLDIEPTIHLGPKASALEKNGIRTERGNINRSVMEMRGLLDVIKASTAVILNSAQIKAVRKAGNEVLDLITAVVLRHKILQLPVMKGKFLRKISNREALQKPENLRVFVSDNNISDFGELQKFTDKHEKVFESLNTECQNSMKRIVELQSLLRAYDRYKPYLEAHKTSVQLKGKEKRDFDRQNKKLLEAYPNEREKMYEHLPEGQKILQVTWRKELDRLQKEHAPVVKNLRKEIVALSCAEVLDYNRTNEMREMNNDRNNIIQPQRRKEQSL